MASNDVVAAFNHLQKLCIQFASKQDNSIAVSELTDRLAVLDGKVYGRICSSPSHTTPPPALSTSKGRKLVFTFGYDGLLSVLQQKNAFDALMELGMLKEYIAFDVNQMGYGSWLVMFLPSASRHPFNVYPATWEGVYNTIQEHYLLLFNDFQTHYQELQQRPYREFEQDAGFQFIESLKSFKSGDNQYPYFDYEYTCSLSRPLKSWQIRAFLYCQLRLLELFDGCGRTRMETSDKQGPCEYLCPVMPFSELDEHNTLILQPLTVIVPT